MVRPMKELTAEQKIEVETLAALLSQDQIADYLGIVRNTFRAICERDPEVNERYKRGKAKAIARHLTDEPLFSGWGVRTLAVGEARYNPIGYHVGTVWPFDNSLIALGLRRYGFTGEAARIAAGILEATAYFEGRLPEAFAGYPRTMTKYPVRYPTACSPQAWSSGAPLLLITAMLGLEPHGDHLVVDPALPSGIGLVALLDIPGRWGRIDAFGRGRVEVDGRTGLRRQLGGATQPRSPMRS